MAGAPKYAVIFREEYNELRKQCRDYTELHGDLIAVKIDSASIEFSERFPRFNFRFRISDPQPAHNKAPLYITYRTPNSDADDGEGQYTVPKSEIFKHLDFWIDIITRHYKADDEDLIYSELPDDGDENTPHGTKEKKLLRHLLTGIELAIEENNFEDADFEVIMEEAGKLKAQIETLPKKDANKWLETIINLAKQKGPGAFKIIKDRVIKEVLKYFGDKALDWFQHFASTHIHLLT